MFRVVVKIWIWAFYRAYTGLLFFIFLLFFGFIKSAEHLALAGFFVSDYKHLLFPLGMISGYVYLFTSYSFHMILHPEKRIIMNIIFLSGKERVKYLLLTINYLMLPGILYILFLILVAIYLGNMLSMAVILLYLFLLQTGLLLVLNHWLIKPAEKTYSRRILAVKIFPGQWALISFYIRYMLLRKSNTFIIVKIISFACLYIVSLLVPTVDHLERYLGISIYFIFILNSIIPMELFRMSNQQMSFIKNLPFNRIMIVLQTFLALLILTLPESILIVRSFTGLSGITFIITVICGGLSALFLLYTLHFILTDISERLVTRIFVFYLLMVLYILYDLSMMFLAVMTLLLGIILFFRYYYRFETEYANSK